MSQVPDVPDNPWWGPLISELVGKFPEVNSWLVIFFVVTSAMLGTATTVLSAIADKTETDKDNKALAIVGKLSKWAAALLGWVNKPTLKPKK
jgi:hypothetical protein